MRSYCLECFSEVRQSARRCPRCGADVPGRVLPAFRFVLVFGLVSALGDIVYEGARSVYGPFLGSLGASALVVSVVGAEELPPADLAVVEDLALGSRSSGLLMVVAAARRRQSPVMRSTIVMGPGSVILSCLCVWLRARRASVSCTRPFSRKGPVTTGTMAS